MASPADHQPPHAPQRLRGPHFRGGLTPSERAELTEWMEKTEGDVSIGIRELAQIVLRNSLLENAVRAAAASALWGGVSPSSTTHAVAMLGVRRTRQLIRDLIGSPLKDRGAAAKN